MTSMNDLPINQLQFYATAPYPCSYLPERTARSQVATPAHVIDTRVYSRLVEAGFRRSGAFTYRPHCDHCRACIPVRIRVPDFRPSRSQRRALHKHERLVANILPLRFHPEHYELYRRYQSARHTSGGMDQDSQEQYSHFLLQSHVRTFLVEFREHSELRMVSIVDELQDGLSSVYTFFDPDVPGASYGVYNILWQIRECERRGRPHLYLGYLIQECRKMAYKQNFAALEGLHEGRWAPQTRLSAAAGSAGSVDDQAFPIDDVPRNGLSRATLDPDATP
ncbi:MAG: arginyltransferase [Pseudomonadota bacterium]|nr:arginyltransferase [Pseudomonadota bacterium]